MCNIDFSLISLQINIEQPYIQVLPIIFRIDYRSTISIVKMQKKSFTGKYNCIYLVYYETYEFTKQGILREKEFKKWRREKKNKLISNFNPKWETLNNQVF